MNSYDLIKNNPRVFNLSESFYDEYALSRLRYIFSEWEQPDFTCVYYNLIVLNDVFSLFGKKWYHLPLSKEYFSHHYPKSIYYYLNFLFPTSFSGCSVMGDMETKFLYFPSSRYVFRKSGLECFARDFDMGLHLAVPTLSFFNVKKDNENKVELYMIDGIDSFSFDLSHLDRDNSYTRLVNNKKLGDTYNVLDYRRGTGTPFKSKKILTITNESYFGSNFKFEIDSDVKNYFDHQWGQILAKMKKDGMGWISSWFDECYDLMPINSILSIKSVNDYNEDEYGDYISYEGLYENRLMQFDLMQYGSKYFTLRKFRDIYGIYLFEEPLHD